MKTVDISMIPPEHHSTAWVIVRFHLRLLFHQLGRDYAEIFGFTHFIPLALSIFEILVVNEIIPPGKTSGTVQLFPVLIHDVGPAI